MTERNRKRGNRKPRTSGAIAQREWKQLHHRRPPIEVLSADEVQAIHGAAQQILEEVGMTVLSEQAQQRYEEFGFDVNRADNRVRFDRKGLMEVIHHAPSSFTLHARNPQDGRPSSG